MNKKVINVGSEPGNQGDGDTLRDAFVKTNANFDELFAIHYVTDDTLQHDDPDTEGTIAYALAIAGAAGGGTVQIGPGWFSCRTTTLTVPENVTLRGVGIDATTINVTHTQDGIAIPRQLSQIESLRLNMPESVSGHGVRISAHNATLRDMALSGVSPSSWGIVVDAASVCTLDNIKIGTSFNGTDAFTGNGILFQNTIPSLKPFNHGDSRIAKIDIMLATTNTTGMKFNGPDGTSNVINNILLSQIDIIGTGNGSGTIGVHLRNAKRIVFHTVDLEQLELAVFEEGAGGNTEGSGNNVFMAVFVFGGGTGYLSSGQVSRRLFLGCDNLKPLSIDDNDVLVPRALWIDDGSTRIISHPNQNNIAFDDGDSATGLKVLFNTDNPTIEPASTSQSSQLTLGATGTSGVECLPGLILPIQSSPVANAVDGMIAQYDAGVVGPDRGLYQLRGASWVFIG
ncbi:MAG: hypothetical protein ACE5FQ_11040 [Thiogranum sp.]